MASPTLTGHILQLGDVLLQLSPPRRLAALRVRLQLTHDSVLPVDRIRPEPARKRDLEVVPSPQSIPVVQVCLAPTGRVRILSRCELPLLVAGDTASVGVVNEYRRGPRQHIVRVLRGPVCDNAAVGALQDHSALRGRAGTHVHTGRQPFSPTRDHSCTRSKIGESSKNDYYPQVSRFCH